MMWSDLNYLTRIEQVLELAEDLRTLPPARLGVDEDQQGVGALRRVYLERARPSLKWNTSDQCATFSHD